MVVEKRQGRQRNKRRQERQRNKGRQKKQRNKKKEIIVSLVFPKDYTRSTAPNTPRQSS